MKISRENHGGTRIPNGISRVDCNKLKLIVAALIWIFNSSAFFKADTAAATLAAALFYARASCNNYVWNAPWDFDLSRQSAAWLAPADLSLIETPPALSLVLKYAKQRKAVHFSGRWFLSLSLVVGVLPALSADGSPSAFFMCVCTSPRAQHHVERERSADVAVFLLDMAALCTIIYSATSSPLFIFDGSAARLSHDVAAAFLIPARQVSLSSVLPYASLNC